MELIQQHEIEALIVCNKILPDEIIKILHWIENSSPTDYTKYILLFTAPKMFIPRSFFLSPQRVTITCRGFVAGFLSIEGPAFYRRATAPSQAKVNIKLTLNRKYLKRMLTFRPAFAGYQCVIKAHRSGSIIPFKMLPQSKFNLYYTCFKILTLCTTV